MPNHAYSRDSAPDDVDIGLTAKKIADAINDQSETNLHGMYSPRYIKKTSRTMQDTKQLIRSISQERGWILRIEEPIIVNNWGQFELEAERGKWLMEVQVDTDGLIDFLSLANVPPRLAVPDRNKTKLRLPFSKQCYVYAGGKSLKENTHFNTTKDARLGVDFGIMDKNGEFFKGDGSRCEDYYVYGMDVLAAADGEVVTAIDGVPDNRPGSVSPHSYSGNTIIIKHSYNEFSVYMHLMPYSIKVKPTQRVTSGQIIGKTGNSGTSTGPHLHFQMMNSGTAQDATGYPPYFQDVLVTREGAKSLQTEKLIEDYTPSRMDSVIQK